MGLQNRIAYFSWGIRTTEKFIFQKSHPRPRWGADSENPLTVPRNGIHYFPAGFQSKTACKTDGPAKGGSTTDPPSKPTFLTKIPLHTSADKATGIRGRGDAGSQRVQRSGFQRARGQRSATRGSGINDQGIRDQRSRIRDKGSAIRDQ